MRQAGIVAQTGKMKNAHNILTGKPEWKRSPQRNSYRWTDNIKMDLKETGG